MLGRARTYTHFLSTKQLTHTQSEEMPTYWITNDAGEYLVEVKREALELCSHLMAMIEISPEEDAKFSLIGSSTDALDFIGEYLRHHTGDTEIDDEEMAVWKELDGWDATQFSRIDAQLVLEILRAADYLGHRRLLKHASTRFCQIIEPCDSEGIQAACGKRAPEFYTEEEIAITKAKIPEAFIHS